MKLLCCRKFWCGKTENEFLELVILYKVWTIIFMLQTD